MILFAWVDFSKGEVERHKRPSEFFRRTQTDVKCSYQRSGSLIAVGLSKTY